MGNNVEEIELILTNSRPSQGNGIYAKGLLASSSLHQMHLRSLHGSQITEAKTTVISRRQMGQFSLLFTAAGYKGHASFIDNILACLSSSGCG